MKRQHPGTSAPSSEDAAETLARVREVEQRVTATLDEAREIAEGYRREARDKVAAIHAEALLRAQTEGERERKLQMDQATREREALLAAAEVDARDLRASIERNLPLAVALVVSRVLPPDVKQGATP